MFESFPNNMQNNTRPHENIKNNMYMNYNLC